MPRCGLAASVIDESPPHPSRRGVGSVRTARDQDQSAPQRRLVAEAVGRVLHDERSPHHHVLVVEGRDDADPEQVRALYVDGTRHGAMFAKRPLESPTEYVTALHVARLLRPAPRDVLFVGAGACIAPKSFLHHEPSVRVDAVEIDPVVAEVAHAHFGVPRDDPRLRVLVGDGRRFMEESDRSYDAVVLDAFSGTDIPRHLLTVEALRLARERLTPDGIVVLNVIASVRGLREELLRSAYATAAEAFATVRVLPVLGAAREGPQNVLLFASPREEAWSRDALADAAAAMGGELGPRVVRYARRMLDDFDARGAAPLADTA